MPIANVGVPDVPPGDLGRANFDQWVRNTLLDLQAALVPPETVTNLRATALPGAIQVDYTRSDGDAYALFQNDTASIQGALRTDLGTANLYVDTLGKGGVKRWYAVQAKKGNVLGALSPWVSQTTLALGTPSTPPEPPPATATPFVDQETDSTAAQVPDKGGFDQI